jgi:glycosyltransferase involved in cell wall biosynthesis
MIIMVRSWQMGNQLSVCILSVEQQHGSGAERVLEYLLWAMRDEKSCKISICAPGQSDMYHYAKKLGYTVLPWEAGKDSLAENLKATLYLAKKIRPRQFDVIFAWTARCFESACLLAWKFKCGSGGTLHDHPQAKFHSLVRRRIISHAARHFNGMACVSAALRAVCSDWPIDNLCVINNGLPFAEEIPRAMVDGGKMRIGFLGGMTGWKGAGVIKDWIARTRQENVEWHWFGSVSAAWQTELANAGVFYHGRLSPVKIYPMIDCVAHPSVEFDPYPTVLLESACAGVPVVASNAGGSGEIVQHEKTGFLYDRKNAETGLKYVRQLSADQLLRRSMGDRARAWFLQKMSVHQMKNAYLDFWQKIVKEKNN